MDTLLYVDANESDAFKAEVAALPGAELIETKHLDGSAHDYIVYGLQLTTAVVTLLTALVNKHSTSKTHLKRGKRTLPASRMNEAAINAFKEA